MNRKQNTQFQMIADFDGDASVLVAERESGEYPILAHAISSSFLPFWHPSSWEDPRAFSSPKS